jgi:hypothetical protein
METLTFMNYLLTLCCEILLNQKKKEICRSTDVVFTDVLQLKHFFMAIKHFQNVFFFNAVFWENFHIFMEAFL